MSVIYWCPRCGDYREVPEYMPLMCCNVLMERPNQYFAKLLKEQER